MIPSPGFLREKVEAVLMELRPMLKADGGDIELVEVSSEGVVRIRLEGFCADCSDSMMAMREGISRVIREQVPAVKEVLTQN